MGWTDNTDVILRCQPVYGGDTKMKSLNIVVAKPRTVTLANTIRNVNADNICTCI